VTQDSTLSQVSSWVTISTFLLTSLNFLAAAFTDFSVLITSLPLHKIHGGLAPKLLIFIILEACLAYTFGMLVSKVYNKGEGMPNVLATCLAFISVWTSFFNIEWIFGIQSINIIDSLFGSLLFFAGTGVLALIGGALAVYFLEQHKAKKDCVQMQGVLYGIGFLIHIFGTL
jgi:hypothetical protein